MLNAQVQVTSLPTTGMNGLPAAPSRGGALSLLGPEAITISYAPRETVYLEEDPADYVFLVRTGTVKTCKFLPDGRRQVTGFLFRGDIFGLHFNGTYVYSAEAVTETIVEGLSRRRLEAAFDRDPALQRKFLATLSDELVAAQEKMLLLGRRSAEEKLAWFLLMLAERYAALAGDDIIRIPMCGADIADYLGLTAETVSRTLSHFKRQGLVRAVAPWKLQLTNRDGLEDIVDGD
jgi:CRP/FNR family transcriptional regulator